MGAIILGLFVACTGEGPPVPPGTRSPPCDLQSQAYIVDQIQLPLAYQDLFDFAFDLDGDPYGHVDNTIGWTVQELTDEGARIPGALQETIDQSELAWMLVVDKCASSTKTYARLSLLFGQDTDGDPSDNWTGDEVFAVADSGPYPAVGTLADGHLSVAQGAGVLPLVNLYESTAQAALDPYPCFGLQADLSLTADGLEGRLGCGLNIPDPASLLSQAVANSMEDALSQDPGCPSMCEDSSHTELLDVYDANGDGHIEASEVGRDSFYFRRFSVEADMLALDGDAFVYWPSHDGAMDSFGLGVRIHAVPAQLAAARATAPLARMPNQLPRN